MTLIMADNYLEKKMEALQARKAKEARAKQIAWKKRMEAYRKRLEAERAAGAAGAAEVDVAAEVPVAGGAAEVAGAVPVAGRAGEVGAEAAVAAGGGPEKSV